MFSAVSLKESSASRHLNDTRKLSALNVEVKKQALKPWNYSGHKSVGACRQMCGQTAF